MKFVKLFCLFLLMEGQHIVAQEIKPDSITLTKAGFKYVIYYDYDIPTNTYIKKHKWE